MANPLDELNPVVMRQGNDVNVIAKQLPVTIGIEGIVYQLFICLLGAIPLGIGIVLLRSGENPIVAILLCACAILPGLFLFFAKQSVQSYLNALEQRIQAAASRIDNYLEQRVVILKNCAKLLDKELQFERETYATITALRSGVPLNDALRNEYAAQIDKANSAFRINVEAYPTLQGITAVQEAMRENSYLQKEITAARDLYNAEVMQWNTMIFQFPLKRIVAARNGYTTRIPFSVSDEVKQQAREVFF